VRPRLFLIPSSERGSAIEAPITVPLDTNSQPLRVARFGIYRDWRAETQTIYFEKIMFWNANPSGHPDWGISPPPG